MLPSLPQSYLHFLKALADRGVLGADDLCAVSVLYKSKTIQLFVVWPELILFCLPKTWQIIFSGDLLILLEGMILYT
jgi:hypothetical protein